MKGIGNNRQQNSRRTSRANKGSFIWRKKRVLIVLVRSTIRDIIITIRILRKNNKSEECSLHKIDQNDILFTNLITLNDIQLFLIFHHLIYYMKGKLWRLEIVQLTMNYFTYNLNKNYNNLLENTSKLLRSN